MPHFGVLIRDRLRLKPPASRVRACQLAGQRSPAGAESDCQLQRHVSQLLLVYMQ